MCAEVYVIVELARIAVDAWGGVLRILVTHFILARFDVAADMRRYCTR